MTRVSPEGAKRQIAYRCYVLVLLAAVAATLPAGVHEVVDAPAQTLLWTAFIAAANLLAVRMLPVLDASLATPVSVASAVVLPPPLAVVVNLLGFTNEREWRRTTTVMPALFNRAQAALSAGAAGAASQILGAEGLVAPTLVAAAVYSTLNTAFVALALWIRRRLDLRTAVKAAAAPFRGFAVNFAMIALLSLLIVLAARQVATVAALVVALPMWLGYSALRHAGASADKAAELADRVAELELLNSLSERLVGVATGEQVVGAVEGALSGLGGADEPGVSLLLAPQASRLAPRQEAPADTSIPSEVAVTAPGGGRPSPRRAGSTALGVRRPVPAPAQDGDQPAGAADGHDGREGGGESQPVTVVPVPGIDDAALVLHSAVAHRHLDVLAAAAGLAGMALQRVALEQDLREAEAARGRLSEEILEEGTRERSRVALLIHDDVLPYLAATQIQADNVASALALDRTEQARELAGVVGSAMQDGMRRLREVLTSLREQIVTPGTLREGLAGLLQEAQLAGGMSGSLDCPDPLPPLPHAVEILAYEVVRGCLANVVRHALAHSVKVTVAPGEGRLVVSVTDDGVGFDPNAVDDSRHGLSLMSSRVSLARGDLRITSTAGAGTAVTATFVL